MDVSIQDDQVDGPHGYIPVRRYEPVRTNGLTTAPTVVWLHGGGFFKGGLNQPESDSVALALAARGYPVVTVDYRLAPLPVVGRLSVRQRKLSNRYPVPVDDVLAVVQHVSDRCGGAIVLGGASAGACLAAGTALRYQHDGGRLAGVLLAYGFFHFTHPRSDKKHPRPRGHRRITHSRWGLNAMNRNYVGRISGPTDHYAFPGGGALQGFPQALLINAERDSMRVSAERFATELSAAGSQVERHLVTGSRHAFLNHPNGEHFSAGVELMAAWLETLQLKPLNEPDRTSVR
ncbi:alpha/beta hydrolase [Leifsonia kafniensis]